MTILERFSKAIPRVQLQRYKWCWRLLHLFPKVVHFPRYTLRFLNNYINNSNYNNNNNNGNQNIVGTVYSTNTG